MPWKIPEQSIVMAINTLLAVAQLPPSLVDKKAR
jgi:hypothetical protein